VGDSGAALPPASSSEFVPGSAYELHPQVALRREPFGALAYHFGNRRLTFVRSVELVELIEQLGDHPSAEAALRALGAGDRTPSMERALATLLRSEVLRER